MVERRGVRVLWPTPIILALKKLRQKDRECEEANPYNIEKPYILQEKYEKNNMAAQ